MYDGVVQELIDELGRLPGVGPKSAQRIAFHIIQTESFDVSRLAHVLQTVRDRVKFCEICGNVGEQEVCQICSDPRRSQAVICVVEEPKDVVAIERTREFKGLYHVLGGALNPMNGVGPDQLRIKGLLSSLQDAISRRDHHRHRPQRRGRGDRHVPDPHAAAARHSRVASRERASGRRRPRVRRRDDPRSRIRGASSHRLRARRLISPHH